MTSPIRTKLSQVMLPAFYDLHRDVAAKRYLTYVLKGGRGSGKSSHIALELILKLIAEPVSGLVVRKVGNTLLDSCYEQLKEAATQLGVSHLLHFGLSPLRVRYLPRGNMLLFRGADDPGKIKSIKQSKFPIAMLWIEELAEFKTEDEVSTIVNSVLRAELRDGLKYVIFYSYNPPKRRQSWVNRKFETQFLQESTRVHHSTYLTNPYISEAFKTHAEDTRERNPIKYDWEFMGQPVGAGVVPFSNLVFRTILDEEIREFDNLRNGMDFGYATDPLCFGRMHYDKTRQRIYIFDELYGVKIRNQEVATWILNKGFNDIVTLCDNETRTIASLEDYGLKVRGVRKGPGSVEFGEEWLDGLAAIVIDPQRCPNIAREFESIDYQVDADGNPRPRLEDKDNHAIDMTRYAMSEDMRGSTYSFD